MRVGPNRSGQVSFCKWACLRNYIIPRICLADIHSPLSTGFLSQKSSTTSHILHLCGAHNITATSRKSESSVLPSIMLTPTSASVSPSTHFRSTLWRSSFPLCKHVQGMLTALDLRQHMHTGFGPLPRAWGSQPDSHCEGTGRGSSKCRLHDKATESYIKLKALHGFVVVGSKAGLWWLFMLIGLCPSLHNSCSHDIKRDDRLTLTYIRREYHTTSIVHYLDSPGLIVLVFLFLRLTLAHS
jgi:hypothetical protein